MPLFTWKYVKIILKKTFSVRQMSTTKLYIQIGPKKNIPFPEILFWLLGKKIISKPLISDFPTVNS